jgi:hypothetical protein
MTKHRGGDADVVASLARLRDSMVQDELSLSLLRRVVDQTMRLLTNTAPVDVIDDLLQAMNEKVVTKRFGH